MRNFLYRLKKKYVSEKMDYDFIPTFMEDAPADILYDWKLAPIKVRLKAYICEAFANGLQDGDYRKLPEEIQVNLMCGLDILETLVKLIEHKRGLYTNASVAYNYGKKLAELSLLRNLSKDIPASIIDEAYKFTLNSVKYGKFDF